MIERGLQSGMIQRPFSIGELVDQSIIREVHAKASLNCATAARESLMAAAL